MADIDWSNYPREVIALDTLGQEETASTFIWDWDLDAEVQTLDPLGQVDALEDAYPYVTVIVPLDTYGELESGTAGYPGLANGTEIIPLEFQPLPELRGITSSKSLIIIPLGCLDEPNEFWG